MDRARRSRLRPCRARRSCSATASRSPARPSPTRLPPRSVPVPVPSSDARGGRSMVRAFVSLVGCVALLLLGGRVCAQERATRLGLDEAVGLALRENPTLRAKGYELEATRANEITAGLVPNPTAAFTSEKYGGTTFIEQTLTVGQTPETGGKRRRRLDSARAASRVSEYEVADVRRLVIFQVKEAFTDALTALAALQLAAQNLKALSDLERLQRLRAEKGEDRKSVV